MSNFSEAILEKLMENSVFHPFPKRGETRKTCPHGGLWTRILLSEMKAMADNFEIELRDTVGIAILEILGKEGKIKCYRISSPKHSVKWDDVGFFIEMGICLRNIYTHEIKTTRLYRNEPLTAEEMTEKYTILDIEKRTSSIIERRKKYFETRR